MAEDTPKVEQAMRGKFPQKELSVEEVRAGLPQPSGAEVEDFLAQLRTFSSGTGAGPTVFERTGRGDG